MPATRLLEVYGSTSWWNGDLSGLPADGILPLTDLSLFESPSQPAALVDDASAEALLSALIRRSTRLVIAEPSDRLAATMLTIEQALPGLLDSISVSTYEGTERARGEFAVTGSGVGGAGLTLVGLRPQPPDQRLASAAALALSPIPRQREVARRAWLAHQTTPASFVSVCATYVAAAAGRDITTAQLLGAMTDPNTASDLLEHSEVRSVLVQRLSAGESSAWAALTSVADRLHFQLLDTIGRELASGSVGHPQHHELVRLMQRLPATLFDAYVDESVAAAAAAPTNVGTWPTALVAAASARLGDATPSSARGGLELALIQRGATQLESHAHNGAVPALIWARMCEYALHSRLYSIRQVSDLLNQQADLVSATVAVLTEDDVNQICITADSNRLSALLSSIGPPAPAARLDALLVQHAARLPILERAYVLASSREALERTESPQLVDLLLDTARARIRYDLSNPEVRNATDQVLALVRGSRDRRLSRWSRLIDSVERLSGPLPDLLKDLDPSDRSLGAALALDVKLRQAQDLEMVNYWVDCFAQAAQYADVRKAEAVLVAGTRAVAVDGATYAGGACLGYVATMVEQKLLARNFVGRGPVAVGRVQALAQRLAELLIRQGPNGIHAFNRALASQGEKSGARSWLEALSKNR